MGLLAGPHTTLEPQRQVVICEAWSIGRSGRVVLRLKADPNPEWAPTMTNLIACRSADKDQRFREEGSLGKDAFSLRESDKVAIFTSDRSHLVTVQVTKDAGVQDADLERALVFAKQVRKAK